MLTSADGCRSAPSLSSLPHCLTTINVTTPTHGIPELTGVAATIAIHWWRRNAVLSIVTGTAACLVMTNCVLPA